MCTLGAPSPGTVLEVAPDPLGDSPPLIRSRGLSYDSMPNSAPEARVRFEV